MPYTRLSSVSTIELGVGVPEHNHLLSTWNVVIINLLLMNFAIFLVRHFILAMLAMLQQYLVYIK